MGEREIYLYPAPRRQTHVRGDKLIREFTAMFLRLVVLALMLMIAIGCGATPTEKPDSTQGESQPVVESPKTTTPVSPTAVPTPEPISLSGTGDYLSSPFELQQGIM